MKEQSTEERHHRPASKYIPVGPYVPADAAVIVGFLLVADAVLVLPTAGLPLRTLVGLPLLCFAPGYALVAALFPGRRRPAGVSGWHDTVTGGRGARRGLDWPQRLGLSLAASVALLPVFGLVLGATGVGYSVAVVAGLVSAFVLCCTVVGVVHRNRLPPDERFGLPVRRSARLVREGLFGGSPVDAVLNVAVAAAVVVAVAALGYGLAVPNHAESYTSVSLLTERGDGELVASGYPETVEESGSELVLQVDNEESTAVEYTVVTQLQRVETEESDLRVRERAELDRVSRQVAAGDTWTHRHQVRPELSGEDLRLVYLVYRGDPPSEPSTESAYRHVAVWVDASGQGAQADSQ